VYAKPAHQLASEEAWAALRAYDRAAILVLETAEGPTAVHAPILVEGDVVRTHVARANPIWRAAPSRALVICPGAEAYISPSWYASKQQGGRVVPTWAYGALHAAGPVTAFEDKARLRSLVAALSTRHEAARDHPWAITDAPGDYIDALLAQIVGLEIRVAALEGKRKFGQERSQADRAGMTVGLNQSADARDRAVATAIAERE
jgi:transcriptional regulator